jgi:hypothetical protein
MKPDFLTKPTGVMKPNPVQLEWSALDHKLLGNVEGCVLLPSRFGWAAQ